MIICYVIHLRDDFLILGRRHLRAVLPVAFIAVIFRRIVAGRDHDTRNTAQRAQRKGQFRRRAKSIEHISLNTVRRKAQSRLIRKLRRHPSGIIGDGNAFLLAALLLYVIGKALRGLTDRINIHAVSTRADHAAKSPRAKRQVLIEAVFNFFLVVSDRQKLLFGSIVKIGVLQPKLKLLFVTHCQTLLVC